MSDCQAPKTVKLLSGDNPQIPKGYGDAPVEAWLAAVPGWKQRVCKEVDRLIREAVPEAQRAIKWNSPLYGLERDLWFTSMHCYKNFVKVAFFQGASLDPVPPGPSKQAAVRYLDLREDDPIDADQIRDWMRQAAALPGEKM
ncbi:DUF1801 domain-containing protein [Paracoccaceae bacterium GXU_MW_L88]